jgi:hypothetical protein
MRTPMLAALLLLLFFSCNQSGYKKDAKALDVAAPAAKPSANTSGATADPVVTSSYLVTDENQAGQFKSPAGAPRQSPPQQTASQANPDWDKKIIKTADLSIETKSFPRFTGRLHQLVRENGGYISQEDQSQSLSQIDNAVSIKVPVDRFDDLLQKLPADSDRLTEKKVSSQDVSMEVVDTRSHLETKKEVRERYFDLLRQAHNMKDILSIQQEIDGIQEEMDAASGRISYLSHSAAFSTINLKFYQILNPNSVETPATEPTFLHKIKLSFLAGWQALSSLLLGLMMVWPLWLALGLGLAAWRRYNGRMNKKPA